MTEPETYAPGASLLPEIEALRQERDQLRRERDYARCRLDIAEKERDRRTAVVRQLRPERDRLQHERDYARRVASEERATLDEINTALGIDADADPVEAIRKLQTQCDGYAASVVAGLSTVETLLRRVEALELLAPYAGHMSGCKPWEQCTCGYSDARAKADALRADQAFTKSPSSDRSVDPGPHSGGGEPADAESTSAAPSGNKGNCGTPDLTAALARNTVGGGAAPEPGENMQRPGPRTDRELIEAIRALAISALGKFTSGKSFPSTGGLAVQIIAMTGDALRADEVQHG